MERIIETRTPEPYKVRIGESKPWYGVTLEMEEEMLELGMKQVCSIKSDYNLSEEDKKEGIEYIEWTQRYGIWVGYDYEVMYQNPLGTEAVLLILNQKTHMSIDGGKPYNWERGIERLKELIRKKVL